MPTGRPTKLTPELQDQIVAAIQRGAYVETAANMAGINTDTFYEWLRKGARMHDVVKKGKKIIRPENQRLIEFSVAIQKATAQGEMRDIVAVDNAAQAGAWQAAAWKLERRNYTRWGRKVAITDDQGGNFFAGMARAWAAALESDQDESPYIAPTKLLNGGSNGGIT